MRVPNFCHLAEFLLWIEDDMARARKDAAYGVNPQPNLSQIEYWSRVAGVLDRDRRDRGIPSIYD